MSFPTKARVSVDYLRKRLVLEPETGKLYWRECEDLPLKWNTRYAGKEAFTAVCARGYKRGSINNQPYLAHHVVFALATGSWYVKSVDHRDGNTLNNRPSNLREATLSQNQANKRQSSANPHKGITLDKRTGKWIAQIRKNGKNFRLGSFVRAEDAAKAYDEAAKQLHGGYARTNEV